MPAFLWFGPVPRVSDLRCAASPCHTAARLEICAVRWLFPGEGGRFDFKKG